MTGEMHAMILWRAVGIIERRIIQALHENELTQHSDGPGAISTKGRGPHGWILHMNFSTELGFVRLLSNFSFPSKCALNGSKDEMIIRHWALKRGQAPAGSECHQAVSVISLLRQSNLFRKYNTL